MSCNDEGQKLVTAWEQFMFFEFLQRRRESPAQLLKYIFKNLAKFVFLRHLEQCNQYESAPLDVVVSNPTPPNESIRLLQKTVKEKRHTYQSHIKHAAKYRHHPNHRISAQQDTRR